VVYEVLVVFLVPELFAAVPAVDGPRRCECDAVRAVPGRHGAVSLEGTGDPEVVGVVYGEVQHAVPGAVDGDRVTGRAARDGNDVWLWVLGEMHRLCVCVRGRRRSHELEC